MVDPTQHVDRFAGREMHWQLREGTGPTVVLVNGAGMSMEHWDRVVELLPGRRVLRFDRPGMGGTAFPGQLPGLDEEVASLAALVRETASADDGGVVLVAHSMGSFHAEALARRHPELVGGIVMVDGSVEELDARPGWRLGQVATGLVSSLGSLPLNRLMGQALRLGVWRQTHGPLAHVSTPRLSDVYQDRDSLAMGTAEFFAYYQQAWDLQLLRRTHPLPRVPVAVLTAADSTERAWPERQARWARLLRAPQHRVERSRHLMMIDRPEVVAQAVLSLDGRDEGPGRESCSPGA